MQWRFLCTSLVSYRQALLQSRYLQAPLGFEPKSSCIEPQASACGSSKRSQLRGRRITWNPENRDSNSIIKGRTDFSTYIISELVLHPAFAHLAVWHWISPLLGPVGPQGRCRTRWSLGSSPLILGDTQEAPQLCYCASSSDLMTKPHHFSLLPMYILQKAPPPHCCCLGHPSLVPIFSCTDYSYSFLIPLSLSAQFLLPDPSDQSLWAISNFVPDLFTPPLLKIGNGCPRLFRQSLGILDMLCEALWDLIPTPLQFQLTPPFAPATCAFFGFMCHAPPATGPLHKLFSLAGVPITLPLELANSYSPFSYHFRVTSTQKLSQSLNQIPHFLNTHIFFFFITPFNKLESCLSVALLWLMSESP